MWGLLRIVLILVQAVMDVLEIFWLGKLFVVFLETNNLRCGTNFLDFLSMISKRPILLILGPASCSLHFGMPNTVGSA